MAPEWNRSRLLIDTLTVSHMPPSFYSTARVSLGDPAFALQFKQMLTKSVLMALWPSQELFIERRQESNSKTRASRTRKSEEERRIHSIESPEVSGREAWRMWRRAYLRKKRARPTVEAGIRKLRLPEPWSSRLAYAIPHPRSVVFELRVRRRVRAPSSIRFIMSELNRGWVRTTIRLSGLWLMRLIKRIEKERGCAAITIAS